MQSVKGVEQASLSSYPKEIKSILRVGIYLTFFCFHIVWLATSLEHLIFPQSSRAYHLQFLKIITNVIFYDFMIKGRMKWHNPISRIQSEVDTQDKSFNCISNNIYDFMCTFIFCQCSTISFKMSFCFFRILIRYGHNNQKNQSTWLKLSQTEFNVMFYKSKLAWFQFLLDWLRF